jgi:hypothetical protein
MKGTVDIPTLLTDRDPFLERVIERLGSHPSDFRPVDQAVRASAASADFRQAAGVLVPLLFRGFQGTGTLESGFSFQLIKRSSRVSQPGDLSCPGGMIHPLWDRLLRILLIHGPLPILRGQARSLLFHRGAALSRIITLFLTNALRETWEEIHLSPCRVRFLGPLPTYTLTLFRRTIFPLAGFVENPGILHPNREVERVVEIPLASFYRKELIGCYRLSTPDPRRPHVSYPPDHPCLIHRNAAGGEDILWGATFQILTQFLEIVMDYHLPDWQNGRIVERVLRPEYLTGVVLP